ncbi:MAG: hypothetical protein ACFB9N_04360 [Geitlerinemataceae cyanobacterium]
MTQHACIAIGIDRYSYMQPLRYALEDAREFHATIAALNDRGESAAPSQARVLGSEYAQNGYTLPMPLPDLATLVVPSPEERFAAKFESETVDPACLLLTEASPGRGGRSTYPTRENILHGLYQWSRESVPADRLLWCFFSGYGLEIDGEDRLLPIDANPERLADSAIPISSVLDALEAAPSDRAILILDINRPTGGHTDSDIGLDTYNRAKARGIPTLLSCQPHQRSRETRDLRHGLFGAALLEALRHRKCPTLDSLERYLLDRVPELCELYWQPTQLPMLAIGPDVPQPFALSGSTDTATPIAPVAPITPTEPIEPVSPTKPTSGSTDSVSSDTDTSDPTPTPIDSPDRVTPSDVDRPKSSATEDFSGESQQASTGLLSSVAVWLGLFASVLGLGVWMNDRVLDESGSPSAVPPADVPAAIEPAPDSADTAPETDSANDTATDTAANSADTAAEPVTNPDTAKARFTNESSNPVALNETPPELLADEPPQLNVRDSEEPVPTSPASAPATAPSETPGETSGETSGETPRTMLAIDPVAIASLHSLAASPLDVAIARARALSPESPGYDRRDRDIERWGTTIFEIAQSRADRGEWTLAIAAARLVPPELEQLQQRANRSIDWWTQAQLNERTLKAARASLDPSQASSYWRAIEKLRAIQSGQPFDEDARAQTEAWATEMLELAQQRADRGQRSSAIASARLIPSDTAAHAAAREAIERWRAD